MGRNADVPLTRNLSDDDPSQPFGLIVLLTDAAQKRRVRLAEAGIALQKGKRSCCKPDFNTTLHSKAPGPVVHHVFPIRGRALVAAGSILRPGATRENVVVLRIWGGNPLKTEAPGGTVALGAAKLLVLHRRFGGAADLFQSVLITCTHSDIGTSARSMRIAWFQLFPHC